jgi:hypothetical protein
LNDGISTSSRIYTYTYTYTHASVQLNLSSGWLRMFRITNAMETASLEDVSEKGMLNGDHGVAAHPGWSTVRKIERERESEIVRMREKKVFVCVCVCV